MTVPIKGGSAMSALTGEITKKAYDKETFVSLMECCSRLFFRDEEIVIIDLLLATEHAISEKDIEIEIGLPEQSIREHLTRLEHHGILTRFSNAQSTNIYQKTPRLPKKEITKETTTGHQMYWRINNHVVLVIHYKLSKMEETLQQRRKSLYECDRFLCPECNSTYDALEVQKLDMDGFDSHFICYCGTKVELDDKSAKDDMYASQQKRCEDQVKTLKKCLYEAWGMDVPEFPIFTRKSALKQLIGENNSTANAEESSIVGETSSATGAPSSVASDSSATNAKDTSNSVIASDTGNQSSIAYSQGGKKIRFHMRVAPGVQNLVKPSSDPVKPITPSREPVSSGIVQEVVSSEIESIKDEVPNFYISKLDKTLSLIEAQEYQQHMTNAEFEDFLELQDRYLNVI
ncbi:transcription initiation factor iie, alpha subunit, putative [Theileria equi strain WA]|uniref:Transcription initiation factor iie, alpha subunit, putative n=1 Tax=Theileria equi strain WA TaxID=1537102 RepID=L1LG67_THEEQ|nr:transcription initiation factor iie, alpha subunit, putative [Theileria equi strain WA]EKX74351.1 transcription initiation factor iie, alpha subunit, putative [Theileria equi strain WA]|eukprot:XP_004833803.1 transcription initiation factor iie, alpha subunit, putative [Theileria equi strain WA]